MSLSVFLFRLVFVLIKRRHDNKAVVSRVTCDAYVLLTLLFAVTFDAVRHALTPVNR